MKFFSGNYQCECGTQFEWKTLFLQSGEGVFGRWDDMQKNVIGKAWKMKCITLLLGVLSAARLILS